MDSIHRSVVRVFRPTVALVCAIALYASPAGAGPPGGWEPVVPEQLAQTASVLEPGADAEVVFSRIWITDRWEGNELVQDRDYYTRVKLFTAQGAQKFSKFDIDLPARGARVENVRARTIQPDGSILTLDKHAVVTETIAKLRATRWRRVSFALPALKPGCILEVRWRETRSGNENLVLQMELQRDIPAREISYYMRPLSITAPGWFVRQIKFHVGSVVQFPLDGYEMTRAVNQRPYMSEPHSPPQYQQRDWMLQYYTQEELTTAEAYWTKLGGENWVWFDRYTKVDKDAKALAQQITQGATTPRDQVERVAQWIQRHFRIVRSAERDSLRAAGLKPSKTARDALAQRGGTEADAALTFATLVRAVGLDVRFLLVPTRQSFFFDRNMMSPWFLPSYQIGVRLEDGWNCFDPVTRYLPWDMVPWDEESQDALLCERDSSRFVATPIAGPERTVRSRKGVFTLAEDGSVEGDLSLEYSGHLNQEYRGALDGVAAGEMVSTLIELEGWSTAGLEVTKVELQNLSEERAPLHVSCHLRLPSHGTVTGKRILFEPALLPSRAGALFTASTRRYPIYFRYPWTDRDSIHIRIPKGWIIESGNPPQKIAASGVAAYETGSRASADGHGVIHERSFRLGEQGSILFPASSYSQLKHLFDRVQEHDRSSVTLVRDDTSP